LGAGYIQPLCSQYLFTSTSICNREYYLRSQFGLDLYSSCSRRLSLPRFVSHPSITTLDVQWYSTTFNPPGQKLPLTVSKSLHNPEAYTMSTILLRRHSTPSFASYSLLQADSLLIPASITLRHEYKLSLNQQACSAISGLRD
jgi:hypothetical protein